MQRLRGKGTLLLALALGSLTSFLTWQYVRQASQVTQPIETAPVVVAAVPIGPRTVITPDMVRVEQLPVASRHPDAAREPDAVVGSVTRVSLTPGEQVLNAKLYRQREESGLAFIVPPGKRAVSVAFSEVIGSGGLILPGDRIDVIGVFAVKRRSLASAVPPNDDEAETTHVATLVLQNIEVLAIAQRIAGEDTRDTVTRAADAAGLRGPAASAAPRSQPQPQAKTVTLAVSPAEALRLVLAEERGKIRLALRRAGDDTTVWVPELPLRAIVPGP